MFFALGYFYSVYLSWGDTITQQKIQMKYEHYQKYIANVERNDGVCCTIEKWYFIREHVKAARDNDRIIFF